MKRFFIIPVIVFGFSLAAQTPTPENPSVPMPTPGMPIPTPGSPIPTPGMPVPAPGTPTPAVTPTATTVIKFEETSHNFGKVYEGQPARYSFKFKNTGNTELVLSSVTASCGCTTPTWPRTAIKPGETAEIVAEYSTSGRPGSFTKNITVVSNGSDQPVILTISGEVIQEPATPKSPIIK